TMPASAAAMEAALARVGVRPVLRLTGPDGQRAEGVQIRMFHNKGVSLVALHQDLPNAGQRAVELTLAQPALLRDLRGREGFVPAGTMRLTLDGVAPTILAVAPAPLPPAALSGPAGLHAGESGTWHVALAGTSPANAHAVRVEVSDPAGRSAPLYSGMLVLRGNAEWTVPFAENDPAGRWTIRLYDALGGGTAELAVELNPASAPAASHAPPAPR
ncbi:MAG TPA: hypothetical protein VGC80_05630, partial [Acetobacteraceae bacterium]